MRALTADELGHLLQALLKPTALIELAFLVGCLAAAWLLVRLLRGAVPRPHSILFGNGVVDGVLFPIFALVLALAARWVLMSRVPLAVFTLVVPVLVSLLVIRVTVRVLRVAFPKSNAMRVVERSLSWLAWIVVVLYFTGAMESVLNELDAIQWKVGSARMSLRKVLEGAITAIVVLVIALWISAALEQQLLKGATDNLSVRKMAANALRALLLFIGLMFALSAAGIDLTALGVLGGALGVGLGFGLQKLAANYVSGFVILAERSVRIGDMVRVDNFEGRITDITTRYTVIRALTGRESIVPNEMLISQRVENSSLADPKVASSTSVQVAYGTKIEPLIEQIQAVVGTVPRVLNDPGPAVQLASFGADGLELQVVYWIADAHNGTGNVKSAINLAILALFEREGVEIPYPQRVVHVPPGPGCAQPAPREGFKSTGEAGST